MRQFFIKRTEKMEARMKVIISPKALLFISFVFSGCANNGFMMAKPSVTLYGRSYPPKKTDSEIEVYRTRRPDTSYVEIGQITCDDTEDDWNMKQILAKAKDIGADGVIIVGRTGAYGVGVPVGNMVLATTEGYGITAIAIRYK